MYSCLRLASLRHEPSDSAMDVLIAKLLDMLEWSDEKDKIPEIKNKKLYTEE